MKKVSETLLPVAGWYPSPTAPAALQYWDGRAWTNHLHHSQVSPEPAPSAEPSGQKSGHRRGGPQPSEGRSRAATLPAKVGVALILLAVVIVTWGRMETPTDQFNPASYGGAAVIYSGQDPVDALCQMWNVTEGLSMTGCLARIADLESRDQAELHKWHLVTGFGWTIGVLGMGLLAWGVVEKSRGRRLARRG